MELNLNSISYGVHYTPIRSLDLIDLFGLEPRRNLILEDTLKYTYPDFAKKTYIYCFLNDTEETHWKSNPYYLSVYRKLMDSISSDGNSERIDYNNLVKITFPILSSDKVFVVDFAKRLNNSSFDYINSFVLLSLYSGGYELPELLIENEIPSERLNIENIIRKKIYSNF
jgi:hypothetical protein